MEPASTRCDGILGLAIKVIVGAVKRGRQRQAAPEHHPDPGVTDDEPGG